MKSRWGGGSFRSGSYRDVVMKILNLSPYLDKQTSTQRRNSEGQPESTSIPLPAFALGSDERLNPAYYSLLPCYPTRPLPFLRLVF